MARRHVHSKKVTIAARQALEDRGVPLEAIGEIVYDMQSPYNNTLTLADCVESVEKVLLKREIQHAILVGVELDRLAEQKKLSEPLQTIIESDEGLFGVDETIALGAALGYGSIAVTTFGHLDKNKLGIIKKLDTKKGGSVHTFLDDIVASIAATASSRIAHKMRDEEDSLTKDETIINEEEELIG
ncbi:phosphatidylglycerophosphatase A [Bacillus aquiflavi]|uniref:Phosphatidylglycerophosphatase A n=1 Tax=Bacillus aquiflavi TaxID=2672567 RepID=A0A6B3VYS6_9BACI|nr:phosphatidylglycerophosphatase A [Bacillus aquiflavi]MBA4536403.1 phosphatidylglycerophosphatase A [Bacillus aquiflavi]NEY80771.1 phosphatidylglycerophosphatase A [Bacillus aquiflavi]